MANNKNQFNEKKHENVCNESQKMTSNNIDNDQKFRAHTTNSSLKMRARFQRHWIIYWKWFHRNHGIKAAHVSMASYLRMSCRWKYVILAIARKSLWQFSLIWAIK